MNPSLVFIAGPTAVGKSEVALQLAEDIGGEIIGCDSMQIYRELTILSNKPSAVERQRVPHHLIDVVSAGEEFNAAQYFQQARAAIEDIVRRDKVPVVCGGSGLYMQVVMDGIFDEEPEDENVRRRLKDEMAVHGSVALHARLREVDPVAADRIHPQDGKRIIRALAFYEQTGTRLSERRQVRAGLWSSYESRAFLLNQDRQRLYDRIDRRVEDMVRAGVVAEVAGLVNQDISRTAAGMIGIREITVHLNGELSLEETVARIQQNTRRYAKRQLTWFRRDSRFQTIDVSSPEGCAEAVRSIKGML